MQITLKPLKGDNFQVSAEPGEKIQSLKQKVAAAKPEFPEDQQKLIFAGKILTDEMTIEEAGIKPDGFIVVMVSKPKTAAPSAPGPAPTPAAAPAPQPESAPAATTPAQPASELSEAAAASNVVTGANVEATVTQLCDMGFERPEVERCLRAAFGNPDRAVEYLMSGIPEGTLEQSAAPGGGGLGGAGAPAPTQPATPGAGLAFPAMPAAGGGGGAGGGPVEIPPALQELRNNPQFTQLAAVVRQNPQMLAQMLPALQQTNPQLLQAIQENPQAFMQMLQEAGGGGGGQADPTAAMMAGAGGGGGMGGLDAMANDPRMAQMAGMLAQNPEMVNQLLGEIEQSDPELAASIRENPQALVQMLQMAARGGMPGAMGGGGGGPAVVQLTPEENAAVERLASLGFDKNVAAQAYLACDKSEELAANFLFDNAGGD